MPHATGYLPSCATKSGPRRWRNPEIEPLQALGSGCVSQVRRATATRFETTPALRRTGQTAEQAAIRAPVEERDEKPNAGDDHGGGRDVQLVQARNPRPSPDVGTGADYQLTPSC
jgi:hypothetical protein